MTSQLLLCPQALALGLTLLMPLLVLMMMLVLELVAVLLQRSPMLFRQRHELADALHTPRKYHRESCGG